MALDTVVWQLQQLESRLNESHTVWRSYDDQVRRDIKIELPPEITGALQPIEYQSAELEKDIYDHVEILRDNPTRFDLVCLDQSKEAKAAERAILLWTARTWAELDADRWWDAAVGEGQVRHGLKGMWLRWRKPQRAGQNLRRNPFYFSNTNLYGLYWTETNENEIDAAYYQFKVPVVEANIERDGKRVTLDALGKIGWLGQHEAHNSDYTQGKQIEVIVCDYRDPAGKTCPLPGCDHQKRLISVYVKGGGAGYNDLEEVETYDSPFPGCSFFLVGGRVSYHETEPFRKYRALMLPSYVEHEIQDYIKTLLATMTRKAYGDEDIYGYAADPTKIQGMEGGAKLDIDRPLPGSNKFPLYSFELRRWPKDIDPHLMTLLQQSEARYAEYRPNRVLGGNAFTEASNATGTAYLALLQQAGLPYNGLLGHSDAAIKRGFNYMYHAIRYWGLADPEDNPTRYPVALTGGEEVMRYGLSVKPGEVVSIDADVLSYDFDLILKTESRTRAEEQAAWLLAWDKYAKGVYTPEDLLKGAGIFDIKGQEEALYAHKIRLALEPHETELMRQYLLQRASAVTGMDFSMALGPAEPAGNGAEPAESLGENNIIVPPNAQMGRSARQLRIAAETAVPNIGGGSEPV